MNVVEQAYLDGIKQACEDRNVDSDALLKYAAQMPGLSSGATKGQGINRMFGAEGKSTDAALTGKQIAVAPPKDYVEKQKKIEEEIAQDPEGNVTTGMVDGRPGVPDPQYPAIAARTNMPSVAARPAWPAAAPLT